MSNLNIIVQNETQIYQIFTSVQAGIVKLLKC